MAGHSKWKNIQFRKGKQDAKKGKVFTKIIREITVAARNGADPNANPRLRLAVDKALIANMSRDTIDRAIKRGAGGDDDANLVETHYEGYAPGGVAVLVYCTTDNKNRTVGDIRYAFSRNGGNLGTDGSVSYLFKEQGLLCFPPKSDENKIMEIALDAGADDVINNEDGSIDVYTSPENFAKVKTAMEGAKLKPEVAEISMIAAVQVPVDKETGEKVMHLIEALEDLDDVQNVFSNADIPDEVYNNS